VNRIALVAVVVLGACSYTPPDESGGDASTPPVVAFEFSTSGTDEGTANSTGSTALIPVVLSKPSDQTVTVDCTAIAGGSATELIDYNVITHTVTFPPGVTSVDVEVDVVKDNDETEQKETIDLALSSPKGATLDAAKAIHELSIADHVLPRISFTTDTSMTDEGTQTMLVLSLDLPADGDSTVVLGVTPDPVTGTDVEDIALADGAAISIPNGMSEVQVPIGEVNDVFDELPIERVTFELKGASQNLVVDATKKTRLHQIMDNDNTPTVQFKVTTSAVNENVGTATIEVELGEESQLPITVTYARQANDTAADADATVTGSSVTFTPHSPGVPGEKLKTINVTIDDDATDEDPETVIVALANPENAILGGQTVHTLTINADATDPPAVVEFAQATSNVNENNTTHNVTITVTPASGKTISVPYTFGGTASISGGGNGQDDYDPRTPSPFSIQPGSTTFQFQVDIKNDSANEGSETISITLGTPQNATVGGRGTHTVTINASN
jgi:hypothetical protein